MINDLIFQLFEGEWYNSSNKRDFTDAIKSYTRLHDKNLLKTNKDTRSNFRQYAKRTAKQFRNIDNHQRDANNYSNNVSSELAAMKAKLGI